MNEGTNATIPEGVRDVQQVNNIIAQESNNVREVSEALQATQQDIKTRLTDAPLLQQPLMKLTELKFTPESWEPQTGKKVSEMPGGFRQQWIASKEKGGVSIEDGWATKGTIDTQKYDVNDVIEFIETFPNKTALKENITSSQSQIVVDLQERFKELTGLEATDVNIQTVLKIDPARMLDKEAAQRAQEETQFKAEQPGEFTAKKKGPSAKKITEGKPKKKIIKVDEKTALTDQIKLEAKAARESVAA